MKFNALKKIMVTGLSTALCVGGVSMANLSNYNGNTIEAAYAAVIKDNPFTATGTVTSNVSMRKGPGTSYARLATLKKGTKVDIVAKSSNSWYKVKYNKGYAYVYSQYINLNKTDDNNNYKEQKFSATGVTNNAVYVRKGAGTSFESLGSLKKNIKVAIVAKTSNNWYKIKFSNDYGYVCGQYINLNKTDDNNNNYKEEKLSATGVVNHAVYVRKGANTTFDKLGSLKKNAKVTIVAKTSNNWYKIKFNKNYGYVCGQYINLNKTDDNNNNYKEEKLSATGVVNHAVYVRKGANTTFDKLGSLKKNAKVTIVAKTSNNWYKVKFNKGYGYVCGQYINLNKTEDDFKYPATGTVNSAVFVRKGASTSYTKLGKLQKNDKVTILSKTTYGWYKINYKNTTGYVYGQYITLDLTK